MVDCGLALLIGLSAPSAYGVQLLVLGSAALLFGAGRLLQRRGEAAPRGPSGP